MLFGCSYLALMSNAYRFTPGIIVYVVVPGATETETPLPIPAVIALVPIGQPKRILITQSLRFLKAGPQI
jgi:hypothetical protein